MKLIKILLNLGETFYDKNNVKKSLKFYSLLLLLSFSQNGYTEKFALIIGGPSKNEEPDRHEFARNTVAATMGLRNLGYNTQTLFGPQQRKHPEKEKYKTDFEKISKLNATAPLTASSINQYFEDLISKVKKGDKVEILVSAHGQDSCGEVGKYMRGDFNLGCNHTFTIYDNDGNQVSFPSEKLFEHIKDLENKGALPNIILSSCHSGRAKPMLEKYGLKKTCAFFQTAGNAVGYGCFESDPSFSKDYTSSYEYMILRYYRNILDILNKDPYFKNSKCFKNILTHFSKNKLDTSTIDSTYWDSRRVDSSFQEPVISSLLSIPYFRGESLSFIFRENQTLQCYQIENKINSLVDQINDSLDQTFKILLNEKLNKFNLALEVYNDRLSEQKNTIKSQNQEKIDKSQIKTREAAQALQRAERDLVSEFGKIFKRKDSNCMRTL